MCSICRAIFGVVFVGEDGEVALIARRGYQMIFYGLQHGTSGLVGVGAVGEAAVLGEVEDFLEIARQLFFLYVEGSEAAYSRCVDDVPFSCRGG